MKNIVIVKYTTKDKRNIVLEVPSEELKEKFEAIEIEKKIIEISLEGIAPSDCSELFSSVKASSIDLSKFDTSNVTNMKEMFYGCKELTSLKTSNWNVGKVKYMDYMFYGCDNLNDLEINWDINNVKDMIGMFKIKENNFKNIMKVFKTKEKKENNFKNNLRIKFKNRKKIKELYEFIYGNKNIDYLEINLTQINSFTDFINEENEIKYLKLTGVEEYIQNHIKFIEDQPEIFRDEIREKKLKEILKRGVQIEKDFCDIFFDGETKRKTIGFYKKELPYIELISSTKNSSYDIIIDNSGKIKLEKKIKEKRMKEIKIQNKKEKIKEVKNIKKNEIEINL